MPVEPLVINKLGLRYERSNFVEQCVCCRVVHPHDCNYVVLSRGSLAVPAGATIPTQPLTPLSSTWGGREEQPPVKYREPLARLKRAKGTMGAMTVVALPGEFRRFTGHPNGAC